MYYLTLNLIGGSSSSTYSILSKLIYDLLWSLTYLSVIIVLASSLPLFYALINNFYRSFTFSENSSSEASLSSISLRILLYDYISIYVYSFITLVNYLMSSTSFIDKFLNNWG
jgi:hypothetical protein